ncbi:MAG: accessory factor UbiK family protein [Thiofilum sp.]|uniref:accessory factor UbiK family protein n=1 Tax=Thiofilum sp. TaxID=2212733 RepID=UPI0025CCF663|nr:accessory factor UbiK family protein [Thiofilum sp.]MBK8452219.1 accessory factor UbiK family protein [Thiofilum sp.]
MSGLNPFESVIRGLSSALPEPLKAMQQEFENTAKQALEGALHKMNLVTREEFDVQMAVLQKTRAKLEALEQQVAELEQHLVAKNVTHPTPTSNTSNASPT